MNQKTQEEIAKFIMDLEKAIEELYLIAHYPECIIDLTFKKEPDKRSKVFSLEGGEKLLTIEVLYDETEEMRQIKRDRLEEIKNALEGELDKVEKEINKYDRE